METQDNCVFLTIYGQTHFQFFVNYTGSLYVPSIAVIFL